MTRRKGGKDGRKEGGRREEEESSYPGARPGRGNLNPGVRGGEK